MKIKIIVSAVSLVLISSYAFAGGGWTKPKGKSYIKVAGWWVESQDFFSGKGEKTSGVTTGLFNANVYAEYGFTDKLTAIAYVPFFSRSYQNKRITNGVDDSFLSGGSLNSIGDIELGAKYSLINLGGVALSGSIILGLPTGNDGGSQVLSLATGDGEFNQIVRVDLGFSFLNTDVVNMYGNIYGGFNNRTKGFSDELRAGFEVGAGVLDDTLWFIGKFDTIQSLNNGTRESGGDSASIFANNSEATNIVAESAYYLTKQIGINGSVSIPLAGQNIFNAPAYSLGLFLDIK